MSPILTGVLGIFLVALAMFFLSIGVIFKKKTPLKGHCHAPVDGSSGCSGCGGSSNDECQPENLKADLAKGKFDISSTN